MNSEFEVKKETIGRRSSSQPLIYTDTENTQKYVAYDTFFRNFLKADVKCVPFNTKPSFEAALKKANIESFNDKGVRTFASCRALSLKFSVAKLIRTCDFVVSTQKGFHIDRKKGKGYLIAATAIIYRNILNVAQSSLLTLPDSFVHDFIKLVPNHDMPRKIKERLTDIVEDHYGTAVATKQISLCDYLYPDLLTESEWILEGVRAASAPFANKSLAFYKLSTTVRSRA